MGREQRAVGFPGTQLTMTAVCFSRDKDLWGVRGFLTCAPFHHPWGVDWKVC